MNDKCMIKHSGGVFSPYSVSRCLDLVPKKIES